MLGFIIKLVSISIICITIPALYLNYSYLKTEKILGPNTKHQIEQSFENLQKDKYELLFIGNSRLYRGINSILFNVKACNFSYDGDTYLQTFYKLKYLNDYDIGYKCVVISADYFSFSLLADNSYGNYYDFFNENYKKVCNSNMVKLPTFKSSIKKETNSLVCFSAMDKYNDEFNAWITKNFSNTIIPFAKGLINTDANRPMLKNNGQYILNTKASENDFIERSSDVYKPLQCYLDSIIDLCKVKNIKLVMTMLPTRENELNNFTQEYQKQIDDYFISKSDDKMVYFFNYKNDKSFKLNHYSDLTHFSVEGADKFSMKLNSDLQELNFFTSK